LWAWAEVNRKSNFIFYIYDVNMFGLVKKLYKKQVFSIADATGIYVINVLGWMFIKKKFFLRISYVVMYQDLAKKS
jgi:hypothetical protein